MENVAFTIEEEAEFTAINCAAFDLHVKNSHAKKEISPCWLCMSNEVKKEAVDELITELRFSVGGMLTADKDYIIKNIFNNSMVNSLAHHVKKWRDCELTAKQLRAEHNPRAFFAEYYGKSL